MIHKVPARLLAGITVGTAVSGWLCGVMVGHRTLDQGREFGSRPGNNSGQKKLLTSV